MNNPYQRLLEENKIKEHKAARDEIESVLEIADRDLGFAKLAMAHNWDWAFTIAYNAAMSASRAYMYYTGYRSSSPESHKTVWKFMLLALPEEYHNRINFFDRMRIKRNRNLYEQAGLVSETELKQLLQSADEYIRNIKSFIK